MDNQKKPKSNLPYIIIGAVLIIAVGAIVVATGALGFGTGWIAGRGTPTPTPKPAKTAAVPQNAPPGANPPNQAGSPTAAVTLEEFADFQCPQCGAKHPVMNEIKATYGTRIHFIFRDFPLQIPAHDKSYDAAVAAEAAGMQNPAKFWEMQNLLFSNQSAWTADPNFRQIWKGYAQTIGLDIPKWENDQAGIQAKGRVDADLARGKGLNVNSTPTLYINGVSVPFEQMTVQGIRQLIDAELQKAPTQNPSSSPAANAGNSNK